MKKMSVAVTHGIYAIGSGIAGLAFKLLLSSSEDPFSQILSNDTIEHFKI